MYQVNATYYVQWKKTPENLPTSRQYLNTKTEDEIIAEVCDRIGINFSCIPEHIDFVIDYSNHATAIKNIPHYRVDVVTKI